MRRAQVLLFLLLLAVPLVARGETAEPADAELEVLHSSLLPDQRAGISSAVRNLARLPRYRIDARLEPDAFRLLATEEVSVFVEAETRELFFRIPANAAFLDRGLGAPVSVALSDDSPTLRAESVRPGLLRVGLDVPAPAGSLLAVRFEVIANVPKQSASAPAAQLMQQAMAFMGGGMARDRQTDYGAFGCQDGVFHLAGAFPELVAPEAGGIDLAGEAGLGEPRWGALGHYTISLVTPAGWLTAGTGTVVGETVERDGSRRVTRVAAAVRGAALVAGQGFAEQKLSAGPVRVRLISRPEFAAQGKKLLDTAARAVRFFASKLGPYPWSDLELAEAPLIDGMECLSWPGLISASSMLIDPDASNAVAGLVPNPEQTYDAVLELAVAHHVAHQWIKGVVGSDARLHASLHEPLALWLGIAYVEQRRGADSAKALLEQQVRRAYRIYRMLGGADARVDRPIDEYRGRAEIDALLHGKAVLFFEALRKLAGDKLLWAGLKRYLTQERFHQLETEGLLPALAGVAPAKAERALQLYDRYFHQLHGDEDVGGPMSLEALLKAAGMQLPPGMPGMSGIPGANSGSFVPVAPVAPPKAAPPAPPASGSGQPATHP